MGKVTTGNGALKAEKKCVMPNAGIKHITLGR